ncbi:MAG TPA: hypothetical protein VFZ66_29740 [Herpetosiphonaceae bacterium]
MFEIPMWLGWIILGTIGGGLTVSFAVATGRFLRDVDEAQSRAFLEWEAQKRLRAQPIEEDQAA